MIDRDKVVTVNLPNGMMVTGTREQVSRTARTFGYVNFFEEECYYSETLHRFVRIDEMETRHLRNAILKQLRENPEINDKTWRALVVEYVTREYDWVDPVGRRS